MSDPVHLHVHSWYSLLEAASSPEALLDRAAACGYSALALTDTNNLYGAMAFSEAAVRYGIRPMLGACLRQNRSRCVALIADASGYRSLCRIISRLNLGVASDQWLVAGKKAASSLATSHWPLATLLMENAEGLHVLVDNEVLAEQLRDAFGPRLWIEIIRPPQSPQHEQRLLECARRLGLPLIASTAVHFATTNEYHAFRLATAVRRTMLLEQLPRRLTITPEHHLVDAETFRQRFHDLPDALRNTRLLAEQLSSSVLPHQVILPPPRVPRSWDANRYLQALCERGLRRREMGGNLSARQRLHEELTVIGAADLAGYFLIVRDIAQYARRNNHSMALRGSAGNSLVCYLLEITDVDPLRFNLPLERFLHPGRSDLPDIDLDFDWKVRDDVIDYVFRRHGDKHTARISSHLFLQPRSAFRESAKAHGLSNTQISALLETLDARVSRIVEDAESSSLQSPSFPNSVWERTVGNSVSRPGQDAKQSFAPERSQTEFGNEGDGNKRAKNERGWMSPPRSFPLEPERWPAIVRDARVLLGRPHHLSIHPGGVVITPQPIENHAPLQMAPKGVVITQFDKDSVEYVGLVKIDLLGNRALATVDEAMEWLRGTGHGAALHGCSTGAHGSKETEMKLDGSDPMAYPCKSVPQPCSAAPWPIRLDDGPDTLQILQQGDTLGVNQLESPAMRHLLIEMQPTAVDDVVQSLALIRPGAASIGAKECFIRRRHGLDPVRVAHASLEPILRETMGLMVYEDDGLAVIQALTGLPGPDADRFRKRVAKHRTEAEAFELTKEFLAACDRNGIPCPAAAEMWVQLAKFNNYSFCKSHAVSYGLIAWKAVTLKARHPLAFWTAALNNNQGMYPRRVYIEAIKRAGIPLRLPCVNRSRGPFSIDDGAIRTGLEAIASLDEALRDKILLDRDREGPYQSLADFRRRVSPGPEALALLIRCGALDFTGQPRPALFLQADLQNQIGPGGELFTNDIAENWSPTDYATVRRFRDEFELLGFITGPPLMSLFRPHVPDDQICSRDLAANVGKRVRLSGLVATARHTPTSDGRDMQFVTLEDEWGLIEVTLFPGTCEPVAYLAMGPYTATGRVEEQYGVVTLTAEKFERD
jgi:DNA-directed DNA polymerase III PolC